MRKFFLGYLIDYWQEFNEKMIKKAEYRQCPEIKNLCGEIEEIPDEIISFVMKEYMRRVLKWCAIQSLRGRLASINEINRYYRFKREVLEDEIEDLID